MQRFITDERTGIRYELIGDYYYPCLTVEESSPLSKYGRLRKRYLREHKHRLTRAHREKQLKMSCQALHNAPPNRT